MDTQRGDERFATKAKSSSVTNFAVRGEKLNTVHPGALRHVAWPGNEAPPNGSALGGVADKPITRAGNEQGVKRRAARPEPVVEPFVFTISVLAVLISSVR